MLLFSAVSMGNDGEPVGRHLILVAKVRLKLVDGRRAGFIDADSAGTITVVPIPDFGINTP